MQCNDKKIVLLGDGVLDNFFWIKNPKKDVRQYLNDCLPDTQVYNFAIDEACVLDVIEGKAPRKELILARKKYFQDNYSYLTNKKGVVKSMDLFEKYANDYCVLSIGGGDGKKYMSSLMWGVDSVLSGLDTDNFYDNLTTLLECVIHKQPKTILIFPYRPHETIFEEYRNSVGWGLGNFAIENWLDLNGRLGELYDKLKTFYFDLAVHYNIPIIDLSRTLDYKERSDYGTSLSKPSQKSGQRIANLISHVITHHDFSKSPRVYFENQNKIIKTELQKK